jgi:gentisate 1,2-dioxygenase
MRRPLALHLDDAAVVLGSYILQIASARVLVELVGLDGGSAAAARAVFAIAEQTRADFPEPESAVSVMAMTSGAAAASADLDSLYRDLRAAHLHPLWRIERDLLTDYPRPRAVPWVWRAAEVYPLGERAIRAVPVDRGGERRVLSLGNPGLGGAPYAAGTLWGALQCLGPGETAPAHRHTPSAIRFVLTGTGVWTTVNGDRCDMGPGDLVLTPSWSWHDHTNSGDRAMFWFDGLDLPMVEALNAVFYEQYPEDTGDPARYKASWRTAGRQRHGPPPLLVYRWADTDAELARLAREQPEAPVVSTEFANPGTGGSVLPTLACSMHRLAAGGRTPTVRRTGNSIFVVFRGEGGSTAGGSRLAWAGGDMFVVPSWVPAAHWSRAGADLFELSDAPVCGAEVADVTAALRDARLLAPVVNPSKIVAAASNYREHVTEMHEVQERTLGRIGLDITIRSPADMVLELERNGVNRQRVSTRDMLVPVQDIVAHASRVMTLLPGDVIFTGAPPGVGPIEPGDSLRVRISRLGEMEMAVR